MDSQLLRNHQESDQKQQQRPAKGPKLQDEQQRQQQQQQPPTSALALFVHEPDSSNTSKLVTAATTSPSASGGITSIIPRSTPTTYPRPGSLFSLSQWQELELQALIYKYMVAGASVPPELILPIRRSLLNETPLYQPYQHFQLASFWGRSSVDPEPERCRRTDGKKWRCSRDVVAGHRYCERHMHRGRSRSRKHVEIPTPAGGGSGMMRASMSPSSSLSPGEQRQSPSPLAGAGLSPQVGVLSLNRRYPDDDNVNKSLPQSYCRSYAAEELGDGSRSGSRTLRHFFNDWPREQQQEPDNTHGTNLSISLLRQPPKSDISLNLCAGNSEKRSPYAEGASGNAVVQPVRASSWSGWASQAATSVGGPLAEALRSSSSTPSPTSVLQKPKASVSETTSSVST